MPSKNDIRMSTHKPYERPSSLEALSGSGLGSTLMLNRSIIWAPDSQIIHLKDLDDVYLAYTALINNGTRDDQEKFLNRELLFAVWPQLSLPWRVYRMWQSSFPELPMNQFGYV